MNFSQLFNTGFTPLSLLASQHPGCYTPRSSGKGAILHNQAGILHSPGLGNLTMNLFENKDALATDQMSLAGPGPHCIAPKTVQAIPDIQQSTHTPGAFTHQDFHHGFMNEPRFDSPTLDSFSFDSATKPMADHLQHAATNTTSQLSPHSIISKNPQTGEK